MTFVPASISLDARARPMPEVAPIARQCLYGKDMVEKEERCDFLKLKRIRIV